MYVYVCTYRYTSFYHCLKQFILSSQKAHDNILYSMCTKSLYYIKCKAIYLLILAEISKKYLTIGIIFTNVC